MKLPFAILMAFGLAQPAFASRSQCSSSDQRVSYEWFRSDGGAFMEREALVLDGETVFERVNYEVPVASVEHTVEGKVVLEGPTTLPNGGVVTTFAQRLTIVAKDAEQGELFSGYVVCTEVIGPICHLCP